jgi:hypothetical protein
LWQLQGKRHGKRRFCFERPGLGEGKTDLMPVVVKSSAPSRGQVNAIIRGEMEAAIRDVGRFVRAQAAIYPPKADSASYRRTGTLGRSITVSKPAWSGKSVQVEVGTNLHYARYVEEGTGIYGPNKRKITPKTAKALAWRSMGKQAGPAAKLIAMGIGKRKGKIGHKKGGDAYMNFAMSVKGMPGWHYMEKAFKSPETEAYFRARVMQMFGAMQTKLAGGAKT